MWQQLELASEIESYLWDTVGYGRKWIFDFNGKTRLVCFEYSNNTGDIYVKTDVFVLQEKSSFKMLGLSFSSKFRLQLLHYLC